jgi:biopolymer transport protein ExbD
MKLVSPLPHKRGRLEIIPLIDIMFFLLAAFMVVSIGKIHLKSLKVSLPTDVPAAQKESKEDFTNISINADGQVQFDKELLTTKEALLARLQVFYAQNKDQKFLISADKDTRHGDVMAVLGQLRAAGFQKVAFSIKGERNPISTEGNAPVPATVPNTSAETSAPASPSFVTTPPPAPTSSPQAQTTTSVSASVLPAPTTSTPPAGN